MGHKPAAILKPKSKKLNADSNELKVHEEIKKQAKKIAAEEKQPYDVSMCCNSVLEVTDPLADKAKDALKVILMTALKAQLDKVDLPQEFEQLIEEAAAAGITATSNHVYDATKILMIDASNAALNHLYNILPEEHEVFTMGNTEPIAEIA